jgi:hypothetical protein
VRGPNAMPRVYSEQGSSETVVETSNSATTSSLASTYMVEAKVLFHSQSTTRRMIGLWSCYSGQKGYCRRHKRMVDFLPQGPWLRIV